jgi:hypothetical protein
MNDTCTNLTKATLLAATLPLAFVMDVVTIGGTLVDKNSFTLAQLQDLKDVMTKATKDQ